MMGKILECFMFLIKYMWKCFDRVLKSMSKVVAWIARTAMYSTFYIEFVFSQLESILVPKKYISY